MGCDIHVHIEHSSKAVREGKKKYWRCFGGMINPGRHYGVFAKLCGVRNYEEYNITPLSEPKGLPENLSYESRGDNSLYISEEDTDSEGCCSRKNAEKWVKDGSSVMDGTCKVTNPDWHSHSFVSADELKEVLNDPQTQYNIESDSEYSVVLGCLRQFEKLGEDARLVFWFDN